MLDSKFLHVDLDYERLKSKIWTTKLPGTNHFVAISSQSCPFLTLHLAFCSPTTTLFFQFAAILPSATLVENLLSLFSVISSTFDFLQPLLLQGIRLFY